MCAVTFGADDVRYEVAAFLWRMNAPPSVTVPNAEILRHLELTQLATRAVKQPEPLTMTGSETLEEIFSLECWVWLAAVD